MSIAAYYLSKIFRVLLSFIVAISVIFCVEVYFRNIEMPLSVWIGSGVLLLISSLVFLVCGLLIAQIDSQQIMFVVANMSYFGLVILVGS